MGYLNDQYKYLRPALDQRRPGGQRTVPNAPPSRGMRRRSLTGLNVAIGLRDIASSCVRFAPYRRTGLLPAGLPTLRCTLRDHAQSTCGPGAR